MQFSVMFIFLAVWLLIFWSGSIAFERTGMERGKARFQALSALTGTGFTTREAESIVNHPKRRQIATWLIFIGNAGIMAFIILMILFIRAELAAPSLLQFAILAGGIIILILIIKLRILDVFTNAILRLFRREHDLPNVMTEEFLHQTGGYGVAIVMVKEKDKKTDYPLRDTGLNDPGITVLSIERGEKVLPLPKGDEHVLAGDYLLCYGEITEIINRTR